MKKYKRYTCDERVALIKECRQSGLSDYQWCHQNGIPSSTFYNWIKQLRKSACSSEPVIPERSVSVATPKQEIVKINVADAPQEVLCQPYPLESTSNGSASIELSFKGCNIKIHNDANPNLLAHTINLLRGSLC